MEDVKGLNDQLENGELSIVSYQYFKDELKFRLYAHKLDLSIWVDGSKLKNQKLLIAEYNNIVNNYKKKNKEPGWQGPTTLSATLIKLQGVQLSNIKERTMLFRNVSKQNYRIKLFQNNCIIPSNPSNDKFDYFPVAQVVLKNASGAGRVNYLLEDITGNTFWIPMVSTSYVVPIISEKETKLSKDDLIVYGFETPAALKQSDVLYNFF